MGRFIKTVKIGTQRDFLMRVDTEKLIKMADNLYIDTNGTVYVVSERDWVDYMTGKTDEIPVPKEEPAADFDVDEVELLGVLFGEKSQPRNPSRIREFCNQLADIWENQCSDWRFCQLISNVLRGQAPGKIPFYVEDDEMMGYLKKYFHLDNERGEIDGNSKYQQR